MSRKRIHTEAEIESLAEMLRPLWRQGDVVRPWLRQHYGMLLELVHGDWSWAAIARAMTLAGITYSTGKAWDTDWLQSEIYRARRPLKGYQRKTATGPPQSTAQQAKTVSAAPMPEAVPVARDSQSDTPGASDSAEFQPARFIDWDTRPAEFDAPPPAEPAKPLIRPPLSTYDEVMARLLGKKSPP
ncbi:MAG: hypothetical protein B7Z71_13465 [Acidocella sp. 21-58-7]|nr:MAG: hypothetical protein B7Z71_13465 [Acidocella sp. 21-58-7]